ncbi:ectonucleotide pyrophosphatase/phosphodiesterase [Rheinheimera sp.]|uniref:alkaline phosphatase family protein n=1 Tax=Rheinheimera sp. TaxID=1869214 RepID=UPI002733DDC5|nr:ectonucleotide pyrophosphatase/phosphodiesterase [Rheinheimera sp.]MDP2713886.1 ectonucleotide pyrophosphatase/phosphodiesterase [Rheinheimera sp.]
MIFSRIIQLVLHFSLLVSFAVTAQPDSVLLISIDGFANRYLQQYPAANIKKLAQEGLRAQSMQPVFPTKTFPNHYSIVTGLYPAKHGIVENNIFDADFDAIFRLNKAEEVTNARWWHGEPIWVTAESQGVKAATYFYPGSEAAIKNVRPSYWQRYDGNVSHNDRVDSVLQWLDLPGAERPRFLSLYFSAVDDAGHTYGPDSAEVAAAIADVDQAIGRLLAGLSQRGLYRKVNIMLVSDHGMAETPPQQVIELDQLFNSRDALLTLWTAEIVSIFPREGKLDSIYQQLSRSLPPQAKVYKKTSLPARWRYRDNNRIAPLLVVPQPGWRLIQQKTAAKYQQMAAEGKTSGSHGYDNQSDYMQAIFIGHGPAFKAGSTIPAFSNTELYNLMCRILGLTPAANDGNPAWPDTVLHSTTGS